MFTTTLSVSADFSDQDNYGLEEPRRSLVKNVYGENSPGRIDYATTGGTVIYATVKVYADGTITLNGSGNATSASLTVGSNKSAYVSVSYYLTYSGSKVIVHYTLHPKQSTTIIRAGRTGTITLG